MYDLVNDVAAYPEFIPGCADSKVISQTEQQMRASLLVSKAGIKQWFTTCNVLVANQSIKMELEEGPFNFLHGHWQFSPLSDQACKVAFSVDFEFSNQLASLAFSQVFKSLMAGMVTAFSKRAKEVYP
jgi:ribosome-associated toxin RatA of RatAB toxin-antitoxin module